MVFSQPQLPILIVAWRSVMKFLILQRLRKWGLLNWAVCNEFLTEDPSIHLWHWVRRGGARFAHESPIY